MSVLGAGSDLRGGSGPALGLALRVQAPAARAPPEKPVQPIQPG